MLFYSLVNPDAGYYIQQRICDLKEEIDIPIFEKAWNLLISSNPVLRTCFVWNEQGDSRQIVRSSWRISVKVIDLQGMSDSEIEERFSEFLISDRKTGFDFKDGPPLRVSVFHLGQSRFRCVWTYHHALFDGRSEFYLLKELFHIFEVLIEGDDPGVVVKKEQYAYLDWIDRGQYSDGAKDYWKNLLAAKISPTSISIKSGFPDKYSGFSEMKYRVSAETVSKLRTFAEENGVTLNTMVQGAWGVLLACISGEDDIVFGATKTIRNSVPAESASEVGLLINTLPVRIQVSQHGGLGEMLTDLRAQWIGMREYENTPLVKVHEWADIKPGKSLFDSIVVFENYLIDSELCKQGGSWESREFRLIERPNYNLNITVYEDAGLTIKAVFNRGHFPDDTIETILSRLCLILDQMSGGFRGRIGELDLVSEKEYQKIVYDWNQTKADYPEKECIHEIFQAFVEKQPDEIAVVFGDETLTYRDLNEKSNRLAWYLRDHGIGPEALVGICTERSLDTIIAIFGVIKAGGAYVPLDPDYPAQRIEFMLEDSSAQVIITQKKFVTLVDNNCRHLVCVDSDWGEISKFSADNPTNVSTQHNLAYVIYTSGSTGRPKGVAMEHHSVVVFISWAASIFTKAELSGVLASTSICFDLSIFEIFVTLCLGGKTILVRNALELPSLSGAYPVTLINTVPSAMTEIVRMDGIPESVKVVNLAGEPLKNSLVQDLYRKEYIESVYDLYGPSEDTTYSTFARMEKGSEKSPLIGVPISNTQAYILGKNLKPVPVGVTGELFLGGEGLARGYYNRPSLTDEKFIPDPFINAEGKKMYRTGDLARYLPDGSIDFLGRIDHQVKIRGFRIEMGEIESVLEKHQDVKECAVVSREDTPGDLRLVAYLVPPSDSSIDIRTIRDHLKTRLPDYMIPAVFVSLEELPLTPNGKLDRSALPVPKKEGGTRGYIPPRDQVEKGLASIWESILGTGPVGLEDDFFELGGHSLLAVRLFSEIAKMFGKTLALGLIFETSTVRGLSALIKGEDSITEGRSLVAINSSGSRPPLYCVHAYGGGVFFYRELSQYLGDDQPFYGLQAQGMDGKSPAIQTVEEMADKYISEILEFQPSGPYYLAGRCLGAYIALEMAHRFQKLGREVAFLGILDSYWMPLRLTSSYDKIQYHLANLSRLGLAMKIVYILTNIKDRFVKATFRAKVFICSFSFKHNKKLPSGLKDFYINTYIPALNRSAEINYNPPLYEGEMIFFQATAEKKRNPRSFWGKHTMKPLKVHMIEAGHLDILVAPNVQRIAQSLRSAIDDSEVKYRNREE
ncbi:MAG: amino acid adenylation domain-containing protein [Candidatus Krumholzibacteria bacterium]|nr:amino acid adenylation domain-containing protein [Candidatus Krumholzibacteria bacterium]